MAEDVGSMPGGQVDEPLGYLVVHGVGSERWVPIFDQLFVGRDCAGISERRRLVIADPEISGCHLEVRLDAATDQAFIIDTSTNGTLVNGTRLQRAVPRPITSADEIRIGDATLTFRSQRFTAVAESAPVRTRIRFSQNVMVMVVGDIINYSTISQITDDGVVAQSLNTLWHHLGEAMRAHHGTLSHYAGDALFAVWELQRFPNAAELAIDFALAANRLVEQLGPDLPMRAPDGSPIRMGWGVVQGVASMATMTRSADAVIGDSTNVAFRLAGLAGRDGRWPVMAVSTVQRSAAEAFAWGAGEHVVLKGRSGTEKVFPVLRRLSASTRETDRLVPPPAAGGGVVE
jgi:adenylate cyclase